MGMGRSRSKSLETKMGATLGVLRKASKPGPGKKPPRRDRSSLAGNRGPRQGSPVSTTQPRSKVPAASRAEKSLGGEWS